MQEMLFHRDKIKNFTRVRDLIFGGSGVKVFNVPQIPNAPQKCVKTMKNFIVHYAKFEQSQMTEKEISNV
jgi:hypothetical protein